MYIYTHMILGFFKQTMLRMCFESESQGSKYNLSSSKDRALMLINVSQRQLFYPVDSKKSTPVCCELIPLQRSCVFW